VRFALAFKICDKCGEKCPARIRKCKKCDAVFSFKVKRKKPKLSRIPDWSELKSGDMIKVSGGPVWIGADGNEIPMGYSGVYAVQSLDSNGILACGADRTSGFCHIWMGGEILSDMGILKRPHRVFKLKECS
jgi:ribosomal protein L40E